MYVKRSTHPSTLHKSFSATTALCNRSHSRWEIVFLHTCLTVSSEENIKASEKWAACIMHTYTNVLIHSVSLLRCCLHALCTLQYAVTLRWYLCQWQELFATVCIVIRKWEMGRRIFWGCKIDVIFHTADCGADHTTKDTTARRLMSAKSYFASFKRKRKTVLVMFWECQMNKKIQNLCHKTISFFSIEKNNYFQINVK